jgi:hypothetical protein
VGDENVFLLWLFSSSAARGENLRAIVAGSDRPTFLISIAYLKLTVGYSGKRPSVTQYSVLGTR